MPHANMAPHHRGPGQREAEQGRMSQFISGVIFLAVMLILFIMSGFRG